MSKERRRPVYATAPYNGTRVTATKWVVINVWTGKVLTDPMTREDALTRELELRREAHARKKASHGRD